MTRALIALVAALAFTTSSDAGWLRNKIAERRSSQSCASGDCTTAASPNGGSVTTANCVNGKCELAPPSLPPPKFSTSVETIVIDGKRYTLVPAK